MGVKMLFNKKAEFTGGSCQSSPELSEHGIGCGCGANSCQSEAYEEEEKHQYADQTM
jgi:hypothetical protein